MGSFDIFHEAADRSLVTHTRTSATISGATTLNAEGSAFTLQSAPSTPFSVGQRIFLFDGAGIAHCVVKKITDSTHLTLLPLQSVGDNVPLPYQFANGSFVIVNDEVAAQQIIDLSEAPNDSYDFLVVSSGVIESTGTPAQTDVYLRLMALQDDPLSGSIGYGAAKVSLSGTDPDRLNFVAATKLTLLGGQRYENYLGFAGPLTGGVVTSVNNPRILALRVTGGYFAGDGKTAVQNTTSTSYVDVTGLDLGANLPAGQYLIAATWALGSTAAAAYADCVLEVDGSTVLANQVSAAPATTDYIPGGFFGVVTLGATNRVRLRLKGNGGSNANIRNAFLAAIPIANIPAIAAAHVSQDLTTDVSQVVTNNNFVALKTSGAVTLQSGRHIEIVSASVGADAPFRSRPNYASAGTGLGNHNVAFGTASTAYVPTFFLVRNRRDAGSTTNTLEGRRNTAVSTTLRARDFTFSWLRETADFVPQPDEKIAVVAEIELGGQGMKSWNSTTTPRRYSHRSDGQRAYSRVRVNGQDYTRVYGAGSLADGTWFWDADASDVYVQLTTAHDALGTPASSAVNIVVVPLLLAGLEKYNLVDSQGTTWPYMPLIKSVPRIEQSIRSDDAKFKASASLGSLQISSAHGAFDDALFRANWESYRVKIRRGYLRRSNRIDDFEVVADAIIRNRSTDFETITLQLLDRRRIMQTPIAKTKITVREGFGSDARTRDDQDLPVLYGERLGVTAWRITGNVGGSDWNEYQFCDHAVKSVSKVWIDTDRRRAIAATNPPLDISTTYTGVGKIRVNNAAFDEPTKPPNAVYVDLLGRTKDGTTSGAALQRQGEIFRDLMVTDWTASPALPTGGTPGTRLIERTLRMIERRWRWQQITGGGRRPVGPRIGFQVSGKTTLEEAVTQLCGETVSYWLVNHQDRVGVDVPDFDRGNLARNGGFEDDSTTAYPWGVINGATLSLTTARKYAGLHSAEISNGSPTNSQAAAVQKIALAAGGTHVITLVASLLEGLQSSFRIGVIGPSGVETLSDPQTLGTGRWTRHSLVYDSEPGDAGFTELRLYPAYGSTTGTRIAVDDVEVYRVACVVDRVNSKPLGTEFEDEYYFECDKPYAVNLQDVEHSSKRRIAESEARGLAATIEPEGKFAIQSSTRATLEGSAADGESAAGLGAPVALYYSRQRPLLQIEVQGLDRIPLVGDYVFHRDNPRVPESPDGYPIWRISKVETSDASGKSLTLEIKQQLDSVIDRVDIAPDNVPMGASAITLSPGSITDYGEVTSLADQFLMGAKSPDVVTQRGDLFHTHSCSHKHPIGPHGHTVTPSSNGIDTIGAGYGPWPVKYDGAFGYPGPFGPQSPTLVSRGLSDGGHGHGVSSAGAAGAATGESSPPNSTLDTPPGPNEPSHLRVRVMQRIANTVDTISADLVVGFLTLPLPAGWTRVTALDGMHLRCAGTLGPMSTTTTGTFTPNDAGSTLPLSSGTGAVLGRRLTVTKSGSTVHVIITVENGANPTVVPLHETNDVANGSFPSGSGAVVTADSQLLVRTNVATSTYTPNDAGSTLKVASATNISVGSLLTVINTDDGNKYVHVVVTAVSGTDLTVTPLHLPGDQANSYSFAAGTGKVVMHSEFQAPTHKHGGTIAAHTHTGGAHTHPAAVFTLGAATNGQQAQKYLGGSSGIVIDAAPDGHTHTARVVPPADNTNSSSAGGSITGDVAPVLPFQEVIWAVSDGTQKTIPASGILLWTSSNQAPGGWSRLSSAKDLFLKGAAAGAGATSGQGGHVHQQSNTAHTMAHAHGGTAIQASETPNGDQPLVEPRSGAGVISVAAGKLATGGGGHAHQVTVTIGSTDPGLTASANDTGAAVLGLPRHKTVMLIQKS